MAENFPKPESLPTPEAQDSVVQTELHRGEVTLDAAGTPVIPQGEAIPKYGINGDILAVITLPGENSSKEIAVIDYGEPDKDNPKPVFIVDGTPIPLMGKATERYGLASLNYTPEGHMASHVGFNDGATVELGRLSSRSQLDANYKLGISGDFPDNELISREHLTISLKDGKFTFADHSTNGTLVRTARPEQYVDDRTGVEYQDARDGSTAKSVGESAVSADLSAVVHEDSRDKLQAELDNLTAGLSEEDRLNLWRYASGMLNKREAQQKGDGKGSILEGQNAGSAYKQLSADADGIAGKYLSIMDRLNR